MVRSLLFSFYFILMGFSQNLQAACGANTRTWQADAASTAWNNNNNWTPRNRPNTAGENAVIISDWFNPTYPGNNFSLGCLEIQSGLMTASAGGRLTIVGDYFRNLNPGSIVVPGGSTWEVRMQAAANQTFENVDTIPRLRINNSETVTITKDFTLTNRFRIDAGSGQVVINEGLTLEQTGAFSIPAGVTLTVSSGAIFQLAGNLTIAGTLVLESGSSLIMANGRVLTISSGGTLDINGSAGNAVNIKAVDSSSTFTLINSGNLDVQYAVFDNLNASGIQINATLSRFDSSNINSIPSSGAGMTIGASASLPADMNSIGFFSDGTAGPFTNVNASSYSGSDADFSNWSGIGDTANENDPNDVINWGTESSPSLQIQNISPSGVPPASIGKGVSDSHFATFAFSMSGTAATATDVTQVVFSLSGSNYNSDVSSISVYNDTNGNCTYDSGVDLLISSAAPAGSPGQMTVNMSSSEVSVIDTTQDCLHVLMSTAATATTDNTIGIAISGTDDVTNSQAYSLSDTAGPPVNAGNAVITGASIARWNGGFGTNMFTGGNWTPNGVPGAATDCEIGNGYSNPVMSGAFNCQNTKFQSSGTINWNNSANIFSVNGAWIVESGFTYQNANNAVVNLVSTGDQSVTLNSTTFPNDININTGGTVTFEDAGSISGNLNLNGGNMTIASGGSLTVSGNLTVASGTTLDIEPGGELILGNGSSLTVNSGGTIEMVGTSGLTATVMAVNDASNYTITVNNGATIRARYYTLRNLGVNGLTINATATIDGTNFLQNGTFIFPGAVGTRFLRLFQEIPGDTLDGMSFDSDGSAATGVVNIATSVGASVDSLDMTNYSGDLSGEGNDNDPVYTVDWTSETNELKLTGEVNAPASANQGDVVNMGSFGFQQLNAGAFNDTDITFIRLTLTGTGSSADVDSASLYYDSSCSGSGGTLIGTQGFSGNPARANFTGITGATVQAHPTTPPLRCFYVEYNINALATNGDTVGVEINSNTHVTNSEAYAFNAGFAPAVNLGLTSLVGTTTQWTGAVSTDWYNAGNWSSGVPTSGLNCIINDQANDPLINAGTAVCKSMDIGNGSLTLSGGSLEIFGSLESTGAITATAPVVIRDDGVTPTSQNIDISSTLSTLQFNKTAGGQVNINSDVNVTNNLNISGAQDFTMNITANNALILNGGLNQQGATIDMDGASELQIGAGQTLAVNGGTFRTSGTNDAYPQTLSNKAQITNTGGSGTWSFSASAGTVDLTGFYIDWLNTSGLNFSGTVSVSNLDGGQLRNLPSSAAMRAVQFNTTGSLPSTASNFGWNWGPNNTPPAEATPYFLAFSSGCGSQTVDFDQWFGDFWPYTTATTADKISAASCTILIDRAKSPVSLTELSATSYDEKVLIQWTTGNEWDHRGFNVYRSLNPNDSFVQINKELIRNDLFSTNIHGTYAFVDEGVSNDVTYYYMLEDLSLMGASTLHGPLEAHPMASLGDVPMIQAGTIASNSDESGAGQGDTSGGEVKEISENVWQLTKTENYQRLRIVVPSLSMQDDPLNTSYKKLTIDGYSPSTEVGFPETPVKTILVKVDGPSSSSQWARVSHLETPTNSVAVTASPEYVNQSGVMTPRWTRDETHYTTNQMGPDQFIQLNDVVKLGSNYYLPIVVHPIKYNPVTQDLIKLDEMILDIFLEGVPPWASVDSSLNPWQREGGVKIGLLEEGMYEVTYDQLSQAGVIGALDGQDVSHIHLRIANAKMGLDITSGNGQFSSGDSLRFYAPSLKSDESLKTFALLYVDSNEISSQASSVDVSDAGEVLTESKGFWTKSQYEENNIAVFNEPFTEETDHFMWSLIYGVSGGVKSPLDVDIDLPYLNTDSTVVIRLLVKSRRANAMNTKHNLELYVNSQTSPVAEESFQAEDSRVITFRVDGQNFVQGKNRISLVASGDNLLAGEYDMLYVDDIDLFYSQEWLIDDDEALVLDRAQNYRYGLNGFSSNQILAYDVSRPSELYNFDNLEINSTSEGYEAKFSIKSQSPGRRIWLGLESQLKSASSYQLIDSSLLAKNDNRADVLYVGHEEMLDRVRALGDLRSSQGFEVAYVSLQKIYNEFGYGIKNVENIKSFFESTKSWQKVPEYIILLGDGTYDPKAYQNASSPYRFPVKYKKGSSFDYVSDHWFVANDQGLSDRVIARIPAKTPEELSVYVNKVLKYENGETRPTDDSPVGFFADKAAYVGEDFEKPINSIQSLVVQKGLLNNLNKYSRASMTDAEFKTSIEESFSESGLVHYMGHGAENMWAGNNVFNNSDAGALTNEKLPIVVAMNCLNAQYSDPGLDSFSEKLIFNSNGGAILFWGSTSFTPPSIQAIYQEAFYDLLAQGNYHNVGDLVKMTKIQAGLSSPFEEILYSWSLIGDPLIKLPVQVQKLEEPVSDEATPEVTAGGGGGCSAGASQGRSKQEHPWALFFGFLLEVFLAFVAIRGIRKLI